jgi:hypothetical protein
VLGICGVGGALVLGVVLILATMGGGESETTVAQNTAGADASDASKQTNAGAESTNSPVGAQLGMTKAIRAWRDPAKKGVLKGLISFEVKRVYWSDSAAPKDDAAAKLLVEIAVTNTGTDPLTYTSWNAPGKSGAWLVDADLQPVASVSGSGSSQQLTPQQTITETLEFATPSKDFNELRLVLPYAAIQRSGQWGYTLSAAVLAGEPLTKPTTAVAKAPASPMPAAEEKPAEPDEPQILKIPDDAAPGIAAKEEPMVDDGEPKEDIRDLIKQSVEPKK